MVDQYEALRKAAQDERAALSQECVDYATSLRSTHYVSKLEGKGAPSMLRAADLFERAAKTIVNQINELSELKQVIARQEQASKDLQRIGGERAREFMLERDALAAQVESISKELLLTRQAAHRGMDAAKKGSAIQLQLAEKARAESSPDALSSEREANAILTAENERLAAQVEALKVDAEKPAFFRKKAMDMTDAEFGAYIKRVYAIDAARKEQQP